MTNAVPEAPITEQVKREEAVEQTATGKTAASAGQRKIPGNLPYLPASGTLKRALDRLQEASRPEKFNSDFLENVLKLTGGAARATIPILKKMGFLTSDSSPTELYAKFRTEGGRGAAALQGLKNAFPEIFKRSEYAHAVDDKKLSDIIVEITGLKATDPIASAIRATFKVVKAFVPANIDVTTIQEEQGTQDEAGQDPTAVQAFKRSPESLSLAYNINIVLPETSDLKILNAIFRSIRENLMR